ncbi:MAG: hypothetical protein AAGH17_01155 [Pseudomonadota bacterium]
MRVFAILLSLLASPSTAWDVTTGAICVLEDQQSGVAVTLTYDPEGPLYSITVTTPTPWADGPVFAIAFLGANPLQITTNQHVLSEDKRAVTVVDRGFDNVLNGMEFNTTAIASLAGREVAFDLQAVDDPMQPFKNCAPQPLAQIGPVQSYG